MKTREELERMTCAQLKAYAKEIGCSLGYAGARKDTTVAAILSHQQYNDRPAGKHPWREFRSVNNMPKKESKYFFVRGE
jgi:hypothetical protein